MPNHYFNLSSLEERGKCHKAPFSQDEEVENGGSCDVKLPTLGTKVVKTTNDDQSEV